MLELTEIEKNQEREANLFAMCLLMPKELIDSDLFGQPPFDLFEDKRINQLARRYNVTEQMMTIRLKQLGYL